MITKSEALARQVSNPESFTDQDIVAAHLRAQDALIGELVEALKNTTVHLIAAHSLLKAGGKKAAASDKIFSIMLDDYEKSFGVGREALAKAEAAR